MPSVSQRRLTLARVVAQFVDSPTDVRTSDALCRVSGVFVPARTFRGWCRAEDLPASALVDLARVLRAVRLARARRCALEECLNGDPRTVQALLHRGGCHPPWFIASMTWSELCRQQTFVRHSLLLVVVERLLMGREPIF